MTNVLDAAIDKITFGEVELLLALFQDTSVRAVGRRLAVSPSQVSRGLRGAEEKLGVVLFRATPQGLLATAEGRALVPHLEQVRAARRNLAARVQGPVDGVAARPPLAVGSVSFVSTHVVAPALAALEVEHGGGQPYVLLDFPPDAMVQAGLNNAFDVCCHLGELEWPRSWETSPVANVRWQLVARPGHGLTRGDSPAREEDVRKFPFVLPGYWSPWGPQAGNDHCPLPPESRSRMATTATAEAALQLAMRTDAVAFLPEVLMRESVRAGRLVVVDVADWEDVARPLYLSVRQSAVSRRIRDLLLLTLREHVEDAKNAQASGSGVVRSSSDSGA
jgi:DNA-binding transcriptional LysR family regulator